ncbi:MAG: hypothetical protein M1829_006861 [Trizodia sp. TS-e1964]|nr:MAG: hypothetical protein M1829_006861 [Trizodia sp. TS-e1964]
MLNGTVGRVSPPCAALCATTGVLAAYCIDSAFQLPEPRVASPRLPLKLEALQAQAGEIKFADALSRVSSRRNAFAIAQPASSHVLAYGSSFIYRQEVLCYVAQDELRALDVHASAKYESVIHLPSVISQHNSNPVRDPVTLLNYCDGIAVCHYKDSKGNSWLFAISVRDGAFLAYVRLDSTEKLFARNNAAYLFYGTYSKVGLRKWIIQGIDLVGRKLLVNKIQLDLIGSDVGSSVSFEIFKDYFYAMSPYSFPAADRLEMSSFYQCYKFPLADACEERVQLTDRCTWRRFHHDGDIVHSWTDLRLHADKGAGEIIVVESRRERGNRRETRQTFYTTELVFPAVCKPLQIAKREGVVYEGPDKLLAHVWAPTEMPQMLCLSTRLARNYHVESDEKSAPDFELEDTKLRFYNREANAHLDLVDDPVESLPGTPDIGNKRQQRLRLRIGSRLDNDDGSYTYNGPIRMCPPTEPMISPKYSTRSRATWKAPPTSAPSFTRPAHVASRAQSYLSILTEPSRLVVRQSRLIHRLG